MKSSQALWVLTLTLLVLLGLNSPLHAGERSRQVLAQSPPETLTWQRLDDMPAGVFSAAASRWQRDVVVTGGINQAGQASDLVQIFNLDTLTWTANLRLPIGVCYQTQVTLADGRILVAGGQTGTLVHGLRTVKKTWIISTDRKTVTPGPDLPRPGKDITSHLLPDGRVVVIGGSSAMLLDPSTHKWSGHIDLREKRHGHASVLLSDGRVLIAGGLGKKSIEMLNPKTGISKQLAVKFSRPRDDLAAELLHDGRVLILGGQDTYTGDTTSECLVIDLSNPNQATMTPIEPLGIPGGAADLATAVVGHWVIALGGETEMNNQDTELATARIVDGLTLKMWSLPDMIVAHDDSLAVADGHAVYILGGYSMGLVKIGPLKVKLPTAVHIVERLVLPKDKFPTADTPPKQP